MLEFFNLFEDWCIIANVLGVEGLGRRSRKKLYLKKCLWPCCNVYFISSNHRFAMIFKQVCEKIEIIPKILIRENSLMISVSLCESC
jgi:hypothetical protein